MSYLNQCEAAREFGVSPRTVRRWVKSAVIPTDVSGRVKRADVVTLLATEGSWRLSRRPRGAKWEPDVLNFVAAVMKQLRKGPVSIGALKSYPQLPQAPGPAIWDTNAEDLDRLRECGFHPVALAAASVALARVPRPVTPPKGRTVERLARRVRREAELPEETLSFILAKASGLLEKYAVKGLLRSRHRSRFLTPRDVFARAPLKLFSKAAWQPHGSFIPVGVSRRQLRSVSEKDAAAAVSWLIGACGLPPVLSLLGVEPPVARPALAKWALLEPQMSSFSLKQQVAIGRAAADVVETVRAWSEVQGSKDGN